MDERGEQTPETPQSANETPPACSGTPANTEPHPRRSRLHVPIRPWVARVLYTLVLALTGLYAISEHRKSFTTSAPMNEASRRFSIYLVAQGLQAYRDSTGTLPATLEEVGLDEENIKYVTDGTTYRLVAVGDSTSLVYAQGADAVRYGSAFKVLEGSAVR